MESETDRHPLEPLPTKKTEEDVLKRCEFEDTLKRLKKATGPDGIPIEIYKRCPKLKEEIFQFIKYVWDKETIPENLGVTKFVIL